MLEVSYKPTFLRQLKKLDVATRGKALTAIGLFKNLKNHKKLRVHKLHGDLSHVYSFSINFNTRIIFEYVSKKEVTLLLIGDHTIYQ
jgi:addiction module RelE/StbE family toxin